MAVSDYFTTSVASALEPRHKMQFSDIPRVPFFGGGISVTCRAYCLYILNHVDRINRCSLYNWGVFIYLQVYIELFTICHFHWQAFVIQ